MYEKTRTLEIKDLSEIPLQGVDLVLLDLDNTLYCYAPCHQKALNALIEGCRVQLGIEPQVASELLRNGFMEKPRVAEV